MFIRKEFDVPILFKHEEFLLEPLTAEHAALDYDAFITSVDLVKGSYRDKPLCPS